MVHDEVDGRRGQFLVTEDCPPLAELYVRREYQAAPLVAARYYLEQQSRPLRVDGHVPELVQDNQISFLCPPGACPSSPSASPSPAAGPARPS